MLLSYRSRPHRRCSSRRRTVRRFASASALLSATLFVGARSRAQTADSASGEAGAARFETRRVASDSTPLFDPERVDFALSAFAQLTGTRTTVQTNSIGTAQTYAQQTAGMTPSAGVLGTFHQQMRPWLGYNVNMGFSRTVENYTAAGISQSSGTAALSSFAKVAIGTDMYEFSVGYVAKGPVATRRMQAFLEGGGGLLAFLPTQKIFPGAVNFRATALIGAGVDYRLNSHLGLRVQYRGLFFKTPDFIQNNGQYPTSKLFTVTSQPSIGLRYTFGPHKSGMQ